MKKNNIPKANFTVQDLPSTRKKQFFDIVSHNFGKLILLGILLLVFTIPFIVNYVVNDSLCRVVIDECSKAGMSQSETANAVFSVNIIFHSINIACYMIISVGVAGILRLVRQMVYGEPIVFKTDFLEGIKKYYKFALIDGLIYGVFVFFINMLAGLFSVSNNSMINIISYVFNGATYFIVLPILLFQMTQYITYDVKYFSSLLNAFKLYVSCFLFIIVLCAFAFAAQFIYLISNVLIVLLILAVICVVFPIFFLILHLYSTYVFDENVNKENYPDIYHKGLKKDN